MTVGSERGEIAEVGSPVTIAEDAAVDRRDPLRWTGIAIGCATAILALTNAPAAIDWLDGLTPRPFTERLREPLQRWAALTAHAGLDRPRATIRHWWEKSREARFGAERPGQDGTTDSL